jgi:hypothetical protein
VYLHTNLEGFDMTDTDTTAVYFSGDWEHNSTLDAYETAYAAVAYGPKWNGFAKPIVTRQVMEAFVARQTMLNADDPNNTDVLRWDGNGVSVDRPELGEEEWWLLPNEDDHFDLGGLGYTFETLDDDDNVIRRIG